MAQLPDARSELAYLLVPAKDLVENFSIDVLNTLTGYLDIIHREGILNAETLKKEAEERAKNPDDENKAASLYKFFNFGEASRVVSGSAQVISRKIDHIYDLTLQVGDIIDNKEGENGAKRGGRGGKRNVNFGSTNYELIDIKALKQETMAGYEKAVREEKKLIDALRMVDNAEIAEAQYERKSCVVQKPTQFMFKLDYGQLNRTDEQIYNSKSRPEVIGKVKDFIVKKAEILHENEVLFSHDDYRKNVDVFTLPGARWIPDNKELAANFGVADIEVELDLDQVKEQISAFGPYTDPLSGREVIAPPRWFVEQEAVRQNQEIQSRATSRATTALRDSQGYGSQATRLSQPFVERHRNRTGLNELVSFVEGRMNKNRPSTHLTNGMVDMFVNNFGDQFDENQDNYQNQNDNYDPFGDDFGGGGGADDDGDSDDYVRNLTRQNVRKRALAPWDDLEKVKIPLYTGDENIPVTRKPVKLLAKRPPLPSVALQRQTAREAKIPKSRRDQFMETHDYLQDYYYWRSAARINPNKDWKVEALRTSILAEKKRRCREKTAKIREIRAQNVQLASQKRTTANARGATVEDFEAAVEGNNDQIEVPNRRTMGAEYDDVVDEDLAAEVELSVFGGGYDYDDDFDVEPRGEVAPPPNNMTDIDGALPIDFDATGGPPPAAADRDRPLMFTDIDDAELNNVITLPINMFMDRAITLLKKFSDTKTDREQMAYEMAKAYEDVDLAVSTLQEQVDKWHLKMEPILDEGETRKEYCVADLSKAVMNRYEELFTTQSIIDLTVDRPWFEVSRYFLSCLFMCNTKNVTIEQDEDIPLEERINTMRVTLLKRELHSDQFKQLEGTTIDDQ